ncbi:hypothetical protein Tco_1041934 [Tanacetum coccineum]|uniref:Uncharacterized protein n=1 Tax=Tanacetum coccineum TaxID=301880 RepID=A0ABQ5GIS0_9ASTR
MVPRTTKVQRTSKVQRTTRCHQKLPTNLSPNLPQKLNSFLSSNTGYDEDPKQNMIVVSQFINIRLYQPWRAILSVLNRYMHSKEQDSFVSKQINIVDSEFKFGMEIPDTMINDAIMQSAGYKFYQSKKKKSEEDNAQEESKEQQVCTIRRG